MEIFLLADIILASIAAAWLVAATIQDIRKREVANWLNFSLIAIALAARAIASVISWQASYFIYGVAAAALFFGIANVFYYARIFAGGDAKLLIALAAAFATTPQFIANKAGITMLGNINIPFMGVFLLNMLFIGSIYGIVWSVALAIRHFKGFKREFKIISRKMKQKKILFLVLFVLFAIAALSSREAILAVISAMFLFFPYLLIFVKAVENSCMIKDVKPNELTEGDWLFKPIKAGRAVIMPKWEGLNNKEIALIKRAKIKNIRIKQGLPFVPVFLIALLISFFANLLIFLVGLFC